MSPFYVLVLRNSSIIGSKTKYVHSSTIGWFKYRQENEFERLSNWIIYSPEGRTAFKWISLYPTLLACLRDKQLQNIFVFLKMCCCSMCSVKQFRFLIGCQKTFHRYQFSCTMCKNGTVCIDIFSSYGTPLLEPYNRDRTFFCLTKFFQWLQNLTLFVYFTDIFIIA